MAGFPLAVARGVDLTRSPDLPDTFVGHIASRVAERPDGRLWSCNLAGERSQGYRELWQRAAAIAGHLLTIGAGPGRPVVLLLGDVLDFVPAFWACVRAGAIAVPLTGAAAEPVRERREAGLGAVLSRLDRPLILADADFMPLARRFGEDGTATLHALAEAEASDPIETDGPSGDPLFLVPTSGSTGRIKLAALSESAVLHRLARGGRSGVDARTSLSVFPFDGISGLRLAYLSDAEQVYMPPSAFAAHPTRLLDTMQRFRVTTLALTNSLAAHVLDAADARPGNWTLSDLRFVGVGAEAVVPAVMRRLRDLLARHGARSTIIRAGYGTTETGPLVLGAEPFATGQDDDAPIALGPCAADVTLRIVGEDGAILLEGQRGQIEARAPKVMFSGYWGEPEATRAAFTSDGWLRTGDLGWLSDGQLTVQGRAKDVIVIHGRKHSLAEIDAHLQAALPAGIRAFACAVRHPGEPAERLAVAFTMQDGGDPAGNAKIADVIRLGIGQRFGLPAHPILVAPADIPLTPAGKIRRSELAEHLLGARPGRPLPAADRPDPTSVIRDDGGVAARRLDRIWCEVLEVPDPPDPDADFFVLGGDSLRALRLSVRVEEAYGQRVSPEAFFRSPTLACLRRLVQGGAVEPTPSPEPAMAWPLPDALRHSLLRYIESWPGERPTRDRLVVGLNTSGRKPPLFWTFQEAKEFARLANRLGSEQPLYGLRSGHDVIDYGEDAIQRLALRYAHEIGETRPDGPIVLGGNCQGGIIALATAQHLLRRERHIPLLILMEWSFPLQSYGERVLLLHGREGTLHQRRAAAIPPWQQAFPHHESAEIAGAHGEFFEDENIGSLSSAIRHHLDAAASRAPILPGRMAYEVEFGLVEGPQRLAIGGSARIGVRVRNRSGFSWDERTLRLALRQGWSDPVSRAMTWSDRRPPLPTLAQGRSALIDLTIDAPTRPGSWQVFIDLDDEARFWSRAISKNALRMTIVVD